MHNSFLGVALIDWLDRYLIGVGHAHESTDMYGWQILFTCDLRLDSIMAAVSKTTHTAIRLLQD